MTVTATCPALPVACSSLSLNTPVSRTSSEPSSVIVPAVTATRPALPDPEVVEEIFPPLNIWSSPPTCTVKSPALPVAPALLSLEMPVNSGWVRSRVPPSMVSAPAVISAVPASPDPEVAEEIFPPLSTCSSPVTRRITSPALPLGLKRLPVGWRRVSLEMPVKSGRMPPSMVNAPAAISTVPARPDPEVSEVIVPPLSSSNKRVTCTFTSPAGPVARELLSLEM